MFDAADEDEEVSEDGSDEEEEVPYFVTLHPENIFSFIFFLHARQFSLWDFLG